MQNTQVRGTEKRVYRNSTQRNQILRYLQNTRTHPNVQTIFRDLKPQIPSLSLGNLYRNLGILAEQGAVLQIQTPGSDEVRYDGTVDDHCHFTCSSCGRLYDLDQPESMGAGCSDLFPGFKVERMAIYLQGTCPDCK